MVLIAFKNTHKTSSKNTHRVTIGNGVFKKYFKHPILCFALAFKSTFGDFGLGLSSVVFVKLCISPRGYLLKDIS